MGKKLTILFLTLAALLAVSGCAESGETLPPEAALGEETTEPDTPAAPAEPNEPEPEPAPALSERDQGWVDDINYLREQIKDNHYDPFYWCPEEEFDWKLDQLAAKVGELSDSDIFFELSAVIAGLGDNHTYLGPPSSGPLANLYYKECFPIDPIHREGKLYLQAYQEGYEQFAPYLCHEIVAVNGVDISYIWRRFEEFRYPYSVAQGTRFENYFVPSFLRWAGCGYQEGFTLQILNDNREVVSLDLPVVSYDEFSAGEWIEPELPKTIKTGGNWAEYIQEGENSCIYVSFADMLVLLDGLEFSDMEYYMDFAEKTNALIAAHPDCRKLVIDLRRNGGGRAGPARYICEIEAPSIEQTYALVGPNTGSAAMTAAAKAKAELDAVLVGSPTGQFTEFFCPMTEKTYATLPYSGIYLAYSDFWYRCPDDIVEVHRDKKGRLYKWENTILPDVYVEQTIEDLREGRDGVMEWVLAQ